MILLMVNFLGVRNMEIRTRYAFLLKPSAHFWQRFTDVK